MPNRMKTTRSRRGIFWMLCLRSLQVKRLQALLGLGSLIVGATVCSLLLNLYSGVSRKMSESFRAFGPNVVAASRAASLESALPSLMDESWLGKLTAAPDAREGFASLPVLYDVARLDPAQPDPRMPEDENVMAVGTDLAGLLAMNPNWRIVGARQGFHSGDCLVGEHLAAEMRFHRGDALRLSPPAARNATPAIATRGAAAGTFRVSGIIATGASEDDQIFVPLADLQRIAGTPGKISLVEMRVPGNAKAIEAAIRRMSAGFPGLTVRPVRQIVYSEGRVLASIGRLMAALTALILVIIALCVAAAMTAIVIERRKDIAVMKALGASDRQVMNIFLGEGAALGLLGGVAGFFIGALLARDTGARLFHVALSPIWSLLPVIAAAAALLAIVATLLPVRRVRAIQPAAALKGA